MRGNRSRSTRRSPTASRATRNGGARLAACFAAGCAVGVLVMDQPKVLPVALASVLNGAPAPVAAPRPDPAIDSWAVSKAYMPESASQAPADIKALAMMQLVVPAHAPDCDVGTAFAGGAERRKLAALFRLCGRLPGRQSG